MSIHKTEFLIEGLIPEKMLTLLLGKPGSYKSWLLAEMALTAVDGGRFLGAYPCKKCDKVIYIDEDTSQSLYQERLERLGFEKIPPAIDQRSMTDFSLKNNQTRENICNEIMTLTASGKRVLVLIDCLIKVAVGLDVDRSNDAAQAMTYLEKIRDAGATVVVTHHMSIHQKDGEPMNSTFIKSGVDAIITLDPIPIQDRHTFVLNPVSKRVELTKPFAVELGHYNEDFFFMEKMEEVPVVPTDAEKQLFKLFPNKATTWSVKGISDSSGRDLPENQIRAGLAQLVKQACLLKKINPHDKSHAVSYKLHPNLDQLNSVYKQLLK